MHNVFKYKNNTYNFDIRLTYRQLQGCVENKTNIYIYNLKSVVNCNYTQ